MDRPTDRTATIPADAAIRAGIEVRPGLCISVATEATPIEPISEAYAAGHFPELVRPLIDLLDTMIAPGARVLDLGAHIGSFSLAATAMGHDVLAVEASPRNVEMLRASVAANGFAGRMRVVNAAVSDGPGELCFVQAGPYGHVVAKGTRTDTIDVPALAMDDLLARVGWDRVDFLKMDIEGSEVAGLRGLSKLLSRPDAPPVFVESNGHTLNFFGKTPADLKATLAGFGYKLYQVEDGRLHPIEPGDFQASTIVDYLALKTAPLPSRTWRVDAPIGTEELIRRVREACVSPVMDERDYIARSIDQAPEAIRADARVREAVSTLARPEVKHVALPSPAAKPARPWYAFWRR